MLDLAKNGDLILSLFAKFSDFDRATEYGCMLANLFRVNDKFDELLKWVIQFDLEHAGIALLQRTCDNGVIENTSDICKPDSLACILISSLFLEEVGRTYISHLFGKLVEEIFHSSVGVLRHSIGVHYSGKNRGSNNLGYKLQTGGRLLAAAEEICKSVSNVSV
jgi:hypothetical protein